MKVTFPVSGLVDRLMLTSAIHIFGFVALVNLAVSRTPGMTWMIWASAVGALVPFHFWLVAEAIASGLQDLRTTRRRAAVIFAATAFALALLPLTGAFFPSQPVAGRVVGPGYYVYVFGLVGLYGALLVGGLRRSRTLDADRRFALRVWLGGGCTAVACILALMALRAATHQTWLVRVQPVIVLGCFAWTAFAITSRRSFRPGQFLLVGLEKLFLVVIVAALAYGLFALLPGSLPFYVAWMMTLTAALVLSVLMKSWWDRSFKLLPPDTSAP